MRARNRMSSFDRMSARHDTITKIVWIYMVIAAIIIALSTFALVGILGSIANDVQEKGGAGKAIGSFIGDIQSGIDESQEGR